MGRAHPTPSMEGWLIIEGKAVGRRKPLFADWSIPLPPASRGGGDRLTLRDLITRIVQAEVEAFRERQEERRLVRVLSADAIDRGTDKGKVEAGGSPLRQRVDEEEAVGTALQAFEDGLYLVVIDGEEQRELEREIHVTAESRITFVRLVMLAGG